MQTSSSAPTRSDTLTSMLAALTSASHPRAREAMTTALHGEVAQAIADSHDLYRRLTQQDRWLSANADHPLFAERENAYLANLAEYEAIEAIIGEAHTALGVESDAARAWQCQGDAFIAWRASHA